MYVLYSLVQENIDWPYNAVNCLCIHAVRVSIKVYQIDDVTVRLQSSMQQLYDYTLLRC